MTPPPEPIAKKKKTPRYKLHWASGRGPLLELKWQIWDWTLRCPVVHLENRALGRQICKLLNEATR